MKAETVVAWVAAAFLASCVFGHTVALRMLLLGSALALAAVVAVRSRKLLRLLPPVWLPFLLWGGWALLSMIWSIEPQRTDKEWRNEVLYAGIALWVCWIAGQARGAERIFGAAIGLAGVAACALSLRDLGRSAEEYAVGWHGGPGDHSSALLVLMPCAVMGAWYVRRARLHAGWLALFCLTAFLFAASAYATLNRTVWLGFAAQLALMTALALRRDVLRTGVPLSMRTALLAAALALGGFAVAGAVMAYVNVKKEGAVVADAVTRDSRLQVWSEIAERIGQRPLVGHGFGRGLDRDGLRRDLGGARNLWHAHNLLLDAALQTGLIGLGLLLALIALLFRSAWRRALDPGDLHAACGIALGGVLTGMLVRNMTDTLLVRQNALLFWGVAAVLMAIRERSWQTSS
jgi:O-antigen ligase